MTYVEKELLPHGFCLVESGDKKVVLSKGHLKLLFECGCPGEGTIALGCPLHHRGNGCSWPVEDAKKMADSTSLKAFYCERDFYGAPQVVFVVAQDLVHARAMVESQYHRESYAGRSPSIGELELSQPNMVIVQPSIRHETRPRY